MRRHLAILTAAIIGGVLVAAVRAQPPWVRPAGKSAAGFQGYWMGIDPVDGGDARRSLLQMDDGRFALAGRDSVLSLCDGTDRGFASFDDGVVIAPNVMESSSLTIRCFNNGALVVLRVTYELVGSGAMVEVTTMQDGTPVSTIVLHRVSTDQG